MGQIREKASAIYANKMPLGVKAVLAGVLCLAASSVWSEYDPPYEPVLEDIAASTLGLVGIDDPFEVPLKGRNGIAGELDMGQHLGEFIVYTQISNKTTQKLFGQEVDSVEVNREAELVSRLYVPGVEVLDTDSYSDGRVYVTQYDAEGNDIGIDVSNALMRMLRPETAHEVGGVMRGRSRAGVRGYTGTIFGVPFEDNILSRLPIFGANSNWSAQNVAMNILSEFGNPNDACYWEEVLIPAMNQAYQDNGIDYAIDGENQIDIAGKTWIRFLIRNKVQGIPANLVDVNIIDKKGTNIDDFKPALPLHERVENVIKLSGGADTVVNLQADADKSFCTQKGSNYTGNIIRMYEYGEQMDNFIVRVALAGMENPPEGLNTATGEIEKVRGDK